MHYEAAPRFRRSRLGCKSPHSRLPEGRGDICFLDILSH
jgi:hypothetical protein